VLLYLFVAASLLGEVSRADRAADQPPQRSRDVPEEIAELQRTGAVGILPAPEEMPGRSAGRRTRATLLKKDGLLLAVTPLADVEFARIRAILPGGRVLLLGEVRKFRKADDRTLVYRKPVRLPKGTRITTEPHVQLELLLEKPKK
jgi:hypothetical protein